LPYRITILPNTPTQVSVPFWVNSSQANLPTPGKSQAELTLMLVIYMPRWFTSTQSHIQVVIKGLLPDYGSRTQHYLLIVRPSKYKL